MDLQHNLSGIQVWAMAGCPSVGWEGEASSEEEYRVSVQSEKTCDGAEAVAMASRVFPKCDPSVFAQSMVPEGSDPQRSCFWMRGDRLISVSPPERRPAAGEALHFEVAVEGPAREIARSVKSVTCALGETAVIRHSLPPRLRGPSAEDLVIVASPYEARDAESPHEAGGGYGLRGVVGGRRPEDAGGGRETRNSESAGAGLRLEPATGRQPSTGPLTEEYTSELKFESFKAKTWNPSARSSGNGRCFVFFDARIELDDADRRVEIWAETAFYHRDAKLLLCKAHWCDVHAGATTDRLAEDRDVAILMSARPLVIDVL